MKWSLVRDYVLYVTMSKLICSHSSDKDGIFYLAIECSVVDKFDEVSNRLVVD